MYMYCHSPTGFRRLYEWEMLVNNNIEIIIYYSFSNNPRAAVKGVRTMRCVQKTCLWAWDIIAWHDDYYCGPLWDTKF